MRFRKARLVAMFEACSTAESACSQLIEPTNQYFDNFPKIVMTEMVGMRKMYGTSRI